MLSALGAAFQSVLTLFFFIAAGFVLRKLGMVKADFSAQLSKIIFSFFLPCMLLDLILNSVELSELKNNALLLLAGVAVIAAGVGAGWLLWLFYRRRGWAFAVPGFAMGFPNFAFMGIPVVTALYGEGASAALLLYILPFYLLVNIVGYMVMSSQKRVDWKMILNPCTIAIIAGFLLKLLPFGMPDFVNQTLSYASGAVSPMAMLAVGLVCGGCGLGAFRENVDLAVISLARLLAFPLCLLGVLQLLGFRGYELAVPVLVSAMPVAANMTILAGTLGKHEEVSARMVFVSTLLSLGTIPLIAGILTRL